MKLARIFQDNMVLQRDHPICVWGTAEQPEHISVKCNGQTVSEHDLPEGDFSFCIPAQGAAEDVTLEIGSVRLAHVDIGEVWIAGGQSNMEFMLQYTADGEQEIKAANDLHLRTYTVGQYSFEGEREAGYKAWNPWDAWLAFTPEHAAELPATALYFAKELRKSGVPVGIVNCSWGGTGAAAWTDFAYLKNKPALHFCLAEFDALTAKLDMAQFTAVKKMVRPALASPESRKTMGMMLKYTRSPKELMAQLRQPPQNDASAGSANGMAGLPMEVLMAVGPGDPQEPGALFANMVREITGFTVRGVLWYQGETDENHAEHYAELLTGLIDCWRSAWSGKNPGQTRLPFLMVQLAPLGTWMNSTGQNFPILRQQQELVAADVPDVWMTSISDAGNVYDIHPKNKRLVGVRLAQLAQKHIYGQDVLADPPQADRLEWKDDTLAITFRHGEGLNIEPNDYSAYNGFPAAEIAPELLPPVTDGINGLAVFADGQPVQTAVCKAESNQLVIQSAELAHAGRVQVLFAQTGFYQVNLYNAAGIPAKPFHLETEVHGERSRI